MQTRAMAEKHKLMINGVEWPGLVSVAERNREKGMIDVPEFDRIRQIVNGQRKIPSFEVVYKATRDSQTYSNLNQWFTQDEIKDVTLIKTDASGVEFARQLMPECQCGAFKEPAYDSAAPNYAQTTVLLVPYDIIDIDSEV